MTTAAHVDAPRAARRRADAAALLALFAEPAEAGRRACEIRGLASGRRIRISAAPPLAPDVRARVLRGDLEIDPPLEPVPADSPAFPDPRAIAAGDRLILRVEQAELPAYCAWLTRAAAAIDACSVAPFSATPGGLLRLHLIAAARVALPDSVVVEARHDLIGVRLAQVALQFGAGALSGPIDPARHLPLAGVPRPSETSLPALAELVRQAGLDPVTEDTP